MKRIILLAMATLFAIALISGAEQSKEAKVISRAKFIRFNTNYNVYTGDAEMYFYTVPECFEGYKVSLRNLRSPEPLKFKVKQAGYVKIVVAGLPVKKLRSKGWTEINSLHLATPNGEVGGKVLVLEKKLGIGDYSVPSEGNFGVRLLVQ